MNPVTVALEPFQLWHAILLACGILTGLEASLLCFVTTLRRRSMVERILATAIPTAVCLGAFTLARAAQLDYDSQRAYGIFSQLHYDDPHFLIPVLADISQKAEQDAALGQLVVVVTWLGLLLGLGLLLWQDHGRAFKKTRLLRAKTAGSAVKDEHDLSELRREPLD